MTAPTASAFSRWLPTYVALLGFAGNIAYTARWAGQIETRLVATEQHAASHVEHMPLTQKLTMFPTRSEFEAQIRMRDTTFSEFRGTMNDHAKARDMMFAEIRQALLEQGKKIDALFLSMPRRNGSD